MHHTWKFSSLLSINPLLFLLRNHEKFLSILKTFLSPMKVVERKEHGERKWWLKFLKNSKANTFIWDLMLAWELESVNSSPLILIQKRIQISIVQNYLKESVKNGKVSFSSYSYL